MSRLQPTITDLSRDPEVVEALAELQRKKEPEQPKAAIKLQQALKMAQDAENSHRGVIARLNLLEHCVATLKAQNVELAKELRSVAELVGVKRNYKNSEMRQQ